MRIPLRILIVDDDPGMSETITDILELKGFEVAAASSGPEALACVQAQAFDVIFMDIKMPGMNGVEALQRMRQLGVETPVLMMTAYAVPDLIAQAQEEGVLAILSKPLPLDRVLEFLAKIEPKMRVLVVEDDPGFATSLQDVLEAQGCTVAHAMEAEAALTAFQQSRPDIVLLDLKLPGRNGYEVLLEIREKDPKADVLLMTGCAGEFEGLVRQSLNHGARMCLEKPLDSTDLLRQIKRIRLERAAAQFAGAAAYVR
jgi:CheY-like chemotaxis protein